MNKKIVRILLVSLLIVIPAYIVYGNKTNSVAGIKTGDINTDKDTINISNTDEIKTYRISDNQEVVVVGDITYIDTSTQEYRTIISVCGDIVSVYYEDIITGIATMSVNGVVTETYDMNEFRQKSLR